MPFYLRAYGKSKYQQDTDRAGTRAEAIIKKGTLTRSALNQGQNGTIDPTLPGTRSSLAERIASGCGRSPATLFAPPAGTLLTCMRNADFAGFNSDRLCRRKPGTKHMDTTNREADSAPLSPADTPATVRARSTWMSWLVVVLLGLLALVSPYLNPQSAKSPDPMVTSPTSPHVWTPGSTPGRPELVRQVGNAVSAGHD